MKPWIAFAIIVGCFAVLTPKFFFPIFKSFFGLNPPKVQEPADYVPRRPHLQNKGSLPDRMREAERVEKMRPHPGMRLGDSKKDTGGGGGGGGKGIMGIILPVYAVGIALYLGYTLVKAFSKNRDNPEEEAGVFSKNRDNTKEEVLREQYKNFHWDDREKEFINSNEDDDLIGLDADYADFIRKKRRLRELDKLLKTEVKEKEKDPSQIETLELGELAENLEFLREKLNGHDKKVVPDNDLEKMQTRLAQTEIQMARLMETLGSLADKMKTITPEQRAAEEAATRQSAESGEASSDEESYEDGTDQMAADEEEEEQEEDEAHVPDTVAAAAAEEAAAAPATNGAALRHRKGRRRAGGKGLDEDSQKEAECLSGHNEDES